MQVAVLKERRLGETRVAATPDTVKKIIGLGASVVVESEAGSGSGIADGEYAAAGAAITSSAAAGCAGADIIVKVRPPVLDDGGYDEVAQLRSGSILVAHLAVSDFKHILQAIAQRGVTAFALELLPRSSRAQTMDVLSSQSNLAGYKAVIDAAGMYGRVLPMMTTAAGTIGPARVLVFGAGVAGLQAIATARRLGAVVYATDVRYSAKEQVESLGARFVMVNEEKMKLAEAAGGYAKEMDAVFKQEQAEAVRGEVLKADIIITTALIPGRPAPRLITAEMVSSMKAGSVIVDLAADAGGNVEGTVKGEKVITPNGVMLFGPSNPSAALPRDASALFARNILNFITPMIGKAGTLNVNWDDELVKGTLVTKEGRIVHPSLGGGELPLAPNND